MDFEIETRSEGELCEKLRRIKLREGNIQPYLNAFISIETLDPAVLAPTQTYCLINELKKIEQLRWDIQREYGWDILQLNGYLKVTYPRKYVIAGERNEKIYECEENSVIDILPPVVEEYIDYRGQVKLIINDGQHRVKLAHQMGMPINVAYVRGSNKSYPYYAYPLPGGWSDVELRDSIPEGYVKKFHVAKEHKKLFRWFNDEFSNIGDSRPYAPAEDKRIITYEHPVHKEGLDPEKEKERMNKEADEMGAGMYGILGSPYKTDMKLPELKDIDIYGYATEEKIKELRDVTFEGTLHCREALMKAKGDIIEAIEILKKRGSLPA